MKVLVIDSDPMARIGLSQCLGRAGHSVVSAADPEQGITVARREQFDVILIGVVPVDMTGARLAGCLTNITTAPIVMVTDPVIAGRVPVDRFGMVDDYLTKPLRPHVLLGAVRANAIRGRRSPRTLPLLTAGDLTINRISRDVQRNGRPVPLRAKGFDLLVALVQHRDIPLSRDRLLSEVWGFAYPGKTRTVDVHINHLRSQLAGSAVAIETVRGVGYRLTAAPRVDA